MSSEYWPEIAALAERSREERESFDPPAEPPAAEEALTYLRNGVGEVVALYIDARTGEPAPFSEVELSLLQRALNDWLELYAACYGTQLDAEFTVREAAELVIDTHDLRDTARILTRVPERDRSEPWSQRKVK